jgi:hypothetical protein
MMELASSSHYSSDYPAPFDVATLPLPEIMDMAFFEKMAAFIVKIKQVTRISAEARHRPVSWDVNGFKCRMRNNNTTITPTY